MRLHGRAADPHGAEGELQAIARSRDRQLRRPWSSPAGRSAREILAVREANGSTHLDVTCLPAILHNRPREDPDGGAPQDPRATAARYDEILCLYGDCGTGGDARPRARRGGRRRASRARIATRSYAGARAFDGAGRGGARHLLPDRLPRPAFRPADRSRGSASTAIPQLLPDYFGNYRARRLSGPAATTPALTRKAAAAGRRAWACPREARHRPRRARRPSCARRRPGDDPAAAVLRTPRPTRAATHGEPAWPNSPSCTGATSPPR